MEQDYSIEQSSILSVKPIDPRLWGQPGLKRPQGRTLDTAPPILNLSCVRLKQVTRGKQ